MQIDANELEWALKKIDIIENVSINFMTQKLTFECDRRKKERSFRKNSKSYKKKKNQM